MTSPLIEVCVEGIDGLVAAQNAGADRVELCASLLEGGLTPSLGTIQQALKLATMSRPAKACGIAASCTGVNVVKFDWASFC